MDTAIVDRRRAHAERAAEEMARAKTKKDRQRAMNFALAEIRDDDPNLTIVKNPDGSRHFNVTCGAPGCEEWATSMASAGPKTTVAGCPTHSV